MSERTYLIAKGIPRGMRDLPKSHEWRPAFSARISAHNLGRAGKKVAGKRQRSLSRRAEEILDLPGALGRASGADMRMKEARVKRIDLQYQKAKPAAQAAADKARLVNVYSTLAREAPKSVLP